MGARWGGVGMMGVSWGVGMVVASLTVSILEQQNQPPPGRQDARVNRRGSLLKNRNVNDCKAYAICRKLYFLHGISSTLMGIFLPRRYAAPCRRHDNGLGFFPSFVTMVVHGCISPTGRQAAVDVHLRHGHIPHHRTDSSQAGNAQAPRR